MVDMSMPEADEPFDWDEVIRQSLEASRQMLAEALAAIDPATATDAQLAHLSVIADMAAYEDEKDVPLSEHEEAEFDHLLSLQHPRWQENHRMSGGIRSRHWLNCGAT